MVVNPKHTQKVNDFIDDDKSVKKFFEILKKNKTSNTINIEKSLMEVGLPNTTLTILRDSIKGYQDVTKLNPNFLTPTLEIILKKQLFFQKYEEVVLSPINISGSVITRFLHNENDWDKVFNHTMKLMRERKMNLRSNDGLDSNDIKNPIYNRTQTKEFQESCKSFGYGVGWKEKGSKVLVKDIQRSKKHPKQRDKFLLRFEEFRKELKKEWLVFEKKRNSFWLESIKEDLRKYNGDYRRVLRFDEHRYTSRRLFLDKPELKSKLVEYSENLNTKSLKQYCDDCSIRYDEFLKKGLKSRDSLYLCGVGKFMGSNYKEFILHKPNFDFDPNINYVRSNVPLTPTDLDRKFKYLDLLKKIKRSYKILPRWVTETKTYTGWFHKGKRKDPTKRFIQPNYETEFELRIDSLIHRNELDIKQTRKLVQKNIKSGELDRYYRSQEKKLEKMGLTLRRKQQKRKSNSYVNKLYNTKGFFKELEDIILNDPKYRYDDRILNGLLNKRFHIRKEGTLTQEIKQLKKEYPDWKKKFDQVYEESVLRRKEKDRKMFLDLLSKTGNLNRTYKLSGIGEKSYWKRNGLVSEKDIRDTLGDFFDRWVDDSKKRCLEFMEKGFHRHHSVSLSGLDFGGGNKIPYGLVYSLDTDKKFKQKFESLRSVVGVERTHKGKTKEDVEFEEKYLNRLVEFQEEILNKNKDFFDKKPKGLLIESKIQPPGKSIQYYSFPDYLLYLRRSISWCITNQKYRTSRTQEYYRKSQLKMEKILRKVPKGIRELTHHISPFGKELFGIDNQIISRECRMCKEYLPIKEFKKHKDGSPFNMCIKCGIMYGRKRDGSPIGTGRKGEVYRGKIIKKYNSLGQVVERRCTSCDQFKPVKKFQHLQRKSSVCLDCYVEIPNNKLTRKGEFYHGKRVRVYDEKTMKVIQKKCNRCEKMKDIDQFNKSITKSNRIDGRLPTCRSCGSIKNQRVNKKIKI